MGITVGSYFSLYDKRAELARIYKKYGARALFIVPARLDRDFMLELICGGEPGFGARPAVWTVGDLLLELQRATKEYERIIDPPDHKLILRWLLSEFLAEAEGKGAALEPGYSHAGFVTVLGENIKDLLAEEVSAGSLRSALGEEVEEYSPESVLIELYERYTEYLEDYGLADAAQIFTLARRKLLTGAGRAFVEGKKIVFAGFLSFTSSGNVALWYRATKQEQRALQSQLPRLLSNGYRPVSETSGKTTVRHYALRNGKFLHTLSAPSVMAFSLEPALFDEARETVDVLALREQFVKTLATLDPQAPARLLQQVNDLGYRSSGRWQGQNIYPRATAPDTIPTTPADSNGTTKSVPPPAGGSGTAG